MSEFGSGFADVSYQVRLGCRQHDELVEYFQSSYPSMLLWIGAYLQVSIGNEVWSCLVFLTRGTLEGSRDMKGV